MAWAVAPPRAVASGGSVVHADVAGLNTAAFAVAPLNASVDPPNTYSLPSSATTAGFSTAGYPAGRLGPVDHVSAPASYTNMLLRGPDAVLPPTTYSLPLSAVPPASRSVIGSGRFVDHVPEGRGTSA